MKGTMDKAIDKFLDDLANNSPHEEMFLPPNLDEIKQELNKEYPKLIKAIHNKKLTQAQKKEAAMKFTDLLEEFAEAFEKDPE